MAGKTLQIDTPAWFAPILYAENPRYIAAFGGRASGKSHAFAEALVERCVYSKTDAVCLREIQKSLTLSVKRLLEIKIEAMGVQFMFEVQRDQIKVKNGGIIIFQGMQNHTADSIKSLEGFDIAWFEEAQNASQQSLDILIPTMRKPGSQLWFTWNPRLEKDPIEKLLRCDDPPPRSVILPVNHCDNPWLPDESRDEMEYCRRRDPDKYAHIWLGAYVRNSEARVFRNWRIEEFESDPAAEYRYGADWGFATDPTTLVRCYAVGRTLYVDYEAYMVGCEINNTPDLFLTVPGAERWPIVADSARPETISYMRNHGFPKIMAAVKGPNSVEEGIEFLKNYDIVVHPRCKHVIDELTLYSYKIDKATSAVLPILEDDHNHVIDALRYATEGIRRVKKASEAPAKVQIPQMINHMAGGRR